MGISRSQPRARVLRLVQRGTIALTAGLGSNTATITSIDTAKSEIGYLGQDATSTSVDSAVARIALTNATTVTATRQGTSGTTTVGFEVRTRY